MYCFVRFVLAGPVLGNLARVSASVECCVVLCCVCFVLSVGHQSRTVWGSTGSSLLRSLTGGLLLLIRMVRDFCGANTLIGGNDSVSCHYQGGCFMGFCTHWEVVVVKSGTTGVGSPRDFGLCPTLVRPFGELRGGCGLNPNRG